MGLCLSVCLSVRVSLSSRSSTKTAERRITQITPHDSTGFYFSYAEDLREIWPGSLHRRAPNAVEWIKIGDFWQITGYISKTVQNRHMVSIKVEYEVVCALSNGSIAHDLECLLTTPTTPFSAFCTAIRNGWTKRLQIWYVDLPQHVPPCRWKIFPERGAGRVRRPGLEFYTLCYISATANG